MKTRNLVSMLLVSLPLASGSIACGSGQTGSDEPTAQTTQDIITTAGPIMAWPAGPVVWNGLVGTWPIGVWSPGTIGSLAFGIQGVSHLGISVAGFPGMLPVPITPTVLNAFVPPVAATPLGVATPFLGASGLFAPAFGFTGAFAPWTAGTGWGFGLNAFGTAGSFSTTFANGAFTPGLNWWMPTLTTSSLMFSNIAAINSFTPFTFNLTFTAASASQAAILSAQAASMASLSIFATPMVPTAIAATTAAIPFMSIAFPILPMPLPVLPGIAPIAPLGPVVAPVPGAVAPVPVAAPLL